MVEVEEVTLCYHR